jgi:hypothetical protein
LEDPHFQNCFCANFCSCPHKFSLLRLRSCVRIFVLWLLLLLLCTALMNRSEELLVISQISLLHKQVMHWIIAKDADGNAWNSSKDNARDLEGRC